MRRTRQREAILTTLREARRPLSPAEICELAAEQVEGINLATVYRNLKTLTEAGETTTVDCVGQPARYEVAGLDHHHHFHCDNCDRLFDITGCVGAALERISPPGFEVRTHHIQLSGVCADCR